MTKSGRKTSSAISNELASLAKPKKSFVKSMRVGAIAENLLIQTLNEYGFIAVKNEDKEKKYDFDVLASVSGTEVSFEVKYDVMAKSTGNLAIEFWNSKKNEPSGLTATKADYWVHVIEEEDGTKIYITSVNNLKGFIEANKPKRVIESGGDKNANLYLYDKEKILSCFTLLSREYFS